MTTGLEQEADPPGQVGGEEAAEQRPDRGGDRGRGPDQGVDLRLRLPSKLPWISDCIAGRYSDAPSPPITAQKTMIAARPWPTTIAAPRRVEDQAAHIGALATEEVAELAADQDERGRHKRLDRHRRLDPADRRVQIRTTAEIETFISDVSITNTNIAAASRTASRGGARPLLSHG